MQYDYIIIGSGLGGLECAYILAKEGNSVCVLEKNRQFGGNLQIFSRDKAIFDTGVHYIGGLDEGQNLHQYFKYFNILDKLKLRRMDEDGFDKITFKNSPNEYPHAMGYDNFVEQLRVHFPKEKAGLRQYVDKLNEIRQAYPLYNVQYQKKEQFDLPFLNANAKDFIESCTTDKTLQNVLAGTNSLYAGHGESTPLYVHALVCNSYIDSAWKCVDGGGQIAKYLVENIKAMGGVARNYSEVKRLQFGEGKAATAVELTTGEIIEGKTFIANNHPAQLMDMVEEKGRLRMAYRNRIKNLKNSIANFTIHIVFKPNSFPYLNHNYYHHETTDAWETLEYQEKDWPSGYAVFVPATSKSQKWADCMNVMAYMRMSEVEKWADTFNTVPKNKSTRNDDYQKFKMERAEQLLDLLERQFPDIRQHIQSYYTSTPLSYRDYIGTKDGSMYGIMKDSRDPLSSFITPRTKIPNLFLTGQNINLHGVLGVTLSSMVTCGQFLGTEYLVGKVKAAQ